MSAADVVVDEDLDENQEAAEAGSGSDGSLGMSDEDFLKQAVPVLEPKAEAKKEEKAEEADPEVAAPASSSPAADEAKKEEKVVDKTPADKTPAKTEKEPAEKVVDKPEEVEKPAAVVDYEAAYKKLTAPFKANGKEIAVESVDDAIALMQMGANYNKKMAALKPQMKLLKMLENNDFLSEDKIGWLIDLGKKDPAAINKLVKESGIDPMDLSAEKASTYKPNTYAVDEREMDLDTVLDELKDSPAYTRTLDVVSNKWDVASKQTVSENPQLLRVVNDHVASGIYDLISTEVERERVFGRLKGMSDIQAYKVVGDAIQARGGFNHLGSKPQAAAPAAPVIVTPKPKAVEPDALKDKRRAAGSTQPAAPATVAKDFNPLALSDEEFSKLGNPKFM